MSTVLGFVVGILAVILAFGFIIFIHEMGHFLTARAVDIRCPQFAIGFGPSLFGFRWRGTNFAVRAFPLGGYVLMNGEEPGDRTEDPWAAAVKAYLGSEEYPAKPQDLLAKMDAVPESERNEVWLDVREQVAYARTEEFENLQMVEGNFHDRSIPARILVISGGVIMNFLATMLLLWTLGPLVGVGSFFREWTPVISQAVSGAPAAEAGVKPGDRIVSVDGQAMVTSMDAFYAIGAHPGTELEMTVRGQDDELRDIKLRPRLAIGRQSYAVDDQGKLTLKSSSEHEDKVGKTVSSVDREGLIALTEPLKGSDSQKYQVQFEGEQKPTSFELPKKFRGPRGQVGVLFGVSDIRFEKELSGVVKSVRADSPAAAAGFQEGDEILYVGDLAVVSNFGQSYGSLLDPALDVVSQIPQLDEVPVLVVRQNQAETVTLPRDPSLNSSQALGLELTPLSQGTFVKAPFVLIGQMLAQPYTIFQAWYSSRYTGKEIVESLQGPIGIMQLIYHLSDNGILQFLFFVALLNAAIGAFNLLPFPALDGSRLVFLVIAGLRGRAVDPDKEAKIHLAGLMVLLGFVVIVSLGDIKRLFSSQLFVL